MGVASSSTCSHLALVPDTSVLHLSTYRRPASSFTLQSCTTDGRTPLKASGHLRDKATRMRHSGLAQVQRTEEAMDRRGGPHRLRARPQARTQEVVQDRGQPHRPHRQAVPREVAQPPEPRHPQDAMDHGRGRDHPLCSPEVRQLVVIHRQASPWKDGQRDQEPLELDDATQVAYRRPGRSPFGRHIAIFVAGWNNLTIPSFHTGGEVPAQPQAQGLIPGHQEPGLEHPTSEQQACAATPEHIQPVSVNGFQDTSPYSLDFTEIPGSTLGESAPHLFETLGDIDLALMKEDASKMSDALMLLTGNNSTTGNPGHSTRNAETWTDTRAPTTSPGFLMDMAPPPPMG